MDTCLLTLLPTEQARCREIARDYTTMGSIGCFAAALIEQALQRADRAIIDGSGEDAIRGVLRELQAFGMARQASSGPTSLRQPAPGLQRLAVSALPVDFRASRMGQARAL
jgi:hypothetical protein